MVTSLAEAMLYPTKLLKRIWRLMAVMLVTATFLSTAALSTVFAQDEPTTATPDPVELFNQGQDEHAKREFAKAIDLYDKALKALPEFPEAEYQKGNALLSLGRTADAESAFRRALELRQDWTLPMIALGTILERRGSFEEAEKFLTKAISLDDSSFPAYAVLTGLRIKTKAAPDTLNSLLTKMKSFSTKENAGAGVFATEASLEIALGDKSGAKKSLQRALAIDPNFKQALYLRAQLALAENDLVLADSVERTLERLDPGSDDLLVLRAKLLLANGKADDARSLLVAVKSHSTEIDRLIENISLASENSPDALEKAVANDPKNAAALGRLCVIYRTSDPRKALEYCRRAVEVDPGNVDHAIGYSAALVQARRFDDAVTVLRRINAVSQDNSTVHANLGTALFELKRYSEAKAEFQWLTARAQVPPVAYYFLAICHDQLGEYLDAGANYQLFLKFADPVNNKDEIDKAKYRLPAIEKLIKDRSAKSKVKSGD